MVSQLKKGGTFLLNTTFSADEIEKHLPNRMLAGLAKKNAKFYIIDATNIAAEIGMGRRTNTILQSAFFALNEQIMPYDKAVELMKYMAKKSYSKKGEEIVQLNYKAIDTGKSGLVEIAVKPEWADLKYDNGRVSTGDEYFDNHVMAINSLEGYDLPVSNFTKYGLLDGSIQNNVALREKRTIAAQVPSWNPDNCIQCGFCSYVCPHATIRTFLLTDEEVANVILNQFPDTSFNDLVSAIKRYRENNTWPTTTKYTKESFNHLQDIMIDYGELDNKVPYEDLMYSIK
jgi:pyruvate-ferredoxin/flavodoxin oxidoreductase